MSQRNAMTRPRAAFSGPDAAPPEWADPARVEIPAAQDAEQAVLGALLLDPDRAVREVRQRITAADFYRQGHRHLFEAITAVADAGGAVDPLTVQAQLTASGTLEAAGGREYLGWLLDIAVTAANVGHHAELVRRAASQRRVYSIASAAATAALERGADAEAVAADAVRQLVGESNGGRQRGFVHLRDVLWDAMDVIERRSRGERAGLIAVGLPELDEAPVYGVEAGDLVTLLLVSGHGKTSLQLSMARYAAEAGTVVGIVSAEMPARQLANRIISGYTAIPFGRLRRGHFYDGEFPRLAIAAGKIGRLPIHIDDSPTPSLSDVAVRVRALKAAHPTLQVVYVDYAQLLSADGDTRALQIEAIANGLKGLAKELGIVVVQSAQPDGKGVDRRSSSDPMPHMADVAWGQGLRNASDLFVCGYRPGKYDMNIQDNEMHCLVRKSRASGEVEFVLHWHGPSMLAWSPRQRYPLDTLTAEAA